MGVFFTLNVQVKEIVTSFGQLKSFHWEVDSHKFPPQVYAFFEASSAQLLRKYMLSLES